MITEYGKILGDVEINSEVTMHGMYAGHVRVKEGGKLILYGIANQLTLEKGSKVEIIGKVTGDVINKGGVIAIAGEIYGKIISKTQDANESSTDEPLGVSETHH